MASINDGSDVRRLSTANDFATAILLDRPSSSSIRVSRHALGPVAHRQLALFHQCTRRGDIAGLERRRAAALTAATACLGKSSGGAFADQRALELRDRAKHMKYEHASRRGCVDALGQRHQTDATFLKIFGCGNQLL
jgi:hypothetical protein